MNLQTVHKISKMWTYNHFSKQTNKNIFQSILFLFSLCSDQIRNKNYILLFSNNILCFNPQGKFWISYQALPLPTLLKVFSSMMRCSSLPVYSSHTGLSAELSSMKHPMDPFTISEDDLFHIFLPHLFA